MPSKTKPQTASQSYAKNVTEIAALLEIISERLPLADCREANWGHVGTVAHVRAQLAEIAAGLALRDPNADESVAHKALEAEIARVVHKND